METGSLLREGVTAMAGPHCRGLFVTGTDTGVGKTYVTAGIVRQLREAGVRVGACKPVASGAETWPAGLVWGDVEALWSALGGEYARERICPQRFVAPLAPPMAARAEGRTVDAPLLRSGVEWWREQVEFLLVEGVGGLLAPVSDHELVADLARDLGFPLLIVARRGLGTINHTLLTLEAAQSRGLPVAGVVLNEPVAPDPGDVSANKNAAELARWSGVPILGEVRHATHQGLPTLRELQTIPWRELDRAGGVPSRRD